jgi:hypothetical protein
MPQLATTNLLIFDCIACYDVTPTCGVTAWAGWGVCSPTRLRLNWTDVVQFLYAWATENMLVKSQQQH